MLRTDCSGVFQNESFPPHLREFFWVDLEEIHKNVHFPHDGKVSLEFLTLSLIHTEKPDFLSESSDVPTWHWFPWFLLR